MSAASPCPSALHRYWHSPLERTARTRPPCTFHHHDALRASACPPLRRPSKSPPPLPRLAFCGAHRVFPVLPSFRRNTSARLPLLVCCLRLRCPQRLLLLSPVTPAPAHTAPTRPHHHKTHLRLCGGLQRSAFISLLAASRTSPHSGAVVPTPTPIALSSHCSTCQFPVSCSCTPSSAAACHHNLASSAACGSLREMHAFNTHSHACAAAAGPRTSPPARAPSWPRVLYLHGARVQRFGNALRKTATNASFYAGPLQKGLHNRLLSIDRGSNVAKVHTDHTNACTMVSPIRHSSSGCFARLFASPSCQSAALPPTPSLLRHNPLRAVFWYHYRPLLATAPVVL